MEIENGETQTQAELFVELYEEVFPKVAAFIQKAGGDLEDTKDIFQDGLVIYYEKTTTTDFVVQVDEQAYLIGICKHLWFKKQRLNARHQELDLTISNGLDMQEEPLISSTIMHFVERAGKRCLDLLQSFYFEKRNMKEIAEHFGFSTEHSATAQKYKCLEKIRTIIKNKSVRKEDFYE
jgi:DNA-directed RNA polymerase specialized sigma24 family protein